ncbi:MAG: hypothetical protein H7Y03_10475 [Chitinophagaceae bacterium]|nr:hypothetical protein [Chitinophagaceae bacterium]
MRKLLLVAAVGLTLVTGCRKIEEDGQIVYLPGTGNGSGNGTGQTIVLRNTITADSTLRKGNTYVLSGRVFIEKGITLTIEPGVTVKGEFSGENVAALIIKRGAKINARGTASEPIIFTSNAPTPKSGDWGGIVICGTARVNAAFNSISGLYSVEGGINDATGRGLAGSGDALYPTPNDDDNSGILQYARIEYAGYAFVPDNEINSLTLAAVGRGTTIDHVEVTYAKDDAFEWFGGTVNCKYLIAYKTQDDDFDTDNGYNGQVQFGLVVRDSSIADISKSEALESDNNATGTAATPKTAPIFSNFTLIGPRAQLTNIGNSNYLGSAVQIRRNSALSLYNSVILGWANGILIDAKDGQPTDANFMSNDLRIKNVLIAGCNNAISYTASTTQPTGADNASIASWFNTQPSPFTNKTVSNGDDARYTRPFDYGNYDFQPYGNSGSPIINFPSATPAVVNNVDFSDSKLVAAIGSTSPNKIEIVTFRGAIAPAGDFANWYKGWTKFQ